MRNTFRHIFTKVVCLVLFCLSANAITAQSGIIRGHVYDKNTGEPILYGNVLVKEIGKGDITNEEGFFSFSNLEEGDYTVEASYVGYATTEVVVNVKKNGITYQAINLGNEGVELGVVNISGQREQARSEVQISKVQVTNKEIKALPSTGGDADILQYLQVIPGVVTTGDQGGQIYIRGGSPVQNLITLDGLTIYNPFHSIGFYSIFETEIIRTVDVLTGGFNAEYGGRISAVVDIKTREGNKQRQKGQISISPFMGKLLLEGPITKPQEGKGTLSYILTGKKSIIESTSKTLYPYALADKNQGLPFDFQDIYGKLSYSTANGSKFNVFGFGFEDEYFNPDIANIDWSNYGGGLSFNLLPVSSSLIVNGKVGFSDYETRIEETGGNPRESGITEYFLGIDFSYFGDDFAFDYGVDVKSMRTNFDFTNQFDQSFSQSQSSTELGAFLKYRKSWNKLVIEPSLRFQYYSAVSEGSLEPRLGLKFNATDRLRFKAAGGFYSQNLISASNERDVVNLFNGFLSAPTDAIRDPEGNKVDSRLQYARHAVAGIEYDLTNDLTVNVEGYIKDFTQLIVINRNKVSVDEANYVTETGDAYGIELSAKYQKPRWNLNGSYTYGFANRDDGTQEYPTVFDRRHNANLLATYNFDAEGNLSLSARYNFGTGFPFTQAQGFYHSINFDDGVQTDIVTANSDNISVIYDEKRNGGRLPTYSRFDVSVTKKWKFSERVNLEAVGSITNVLDRENIFYFDRLAYKRVDQLPIIPSIGLKLNF